MIIALLMMAGLYAGVLIPPVPVSTPKKYVADVGDRGNEVTFPVSASSQCIYRPVVGEPRGEYLCE
jgi:hypothetical protein